MYEYYTFNFLVVNGTRITSCQISSVNKENWVCKCTISNCTITLFILNGWMTHVVMKNAFTRFDIFYIIYDLTKMFNLRLKEGYKAYNISYIRTPLFCKAPAYPT